MSIAGIAKSANARSRAELHNANTTRDTRTADPLLRVPISSDIPCHQETMRRCAVAVVSRIYRLHFLM